MGTRWTMDIDGVHHVSTFTKREAFGLISVAVITVAILLVTAWLSNPLHQPASEFSCYENEFMVVLPPGELPAYIDHHKHCLPMDDVLGEIIGYID